MNAPEQRLLPSTGADALWAELQSTASRERLSALWLRWAAGLLPGCSAGLVLLDDGSGTLVATASMPEGLDVLTLQAVVAQAVELRALSIQPSGRGHELALPLLRDGRPCGAVALVLPGSDAAAVWHAAGTLRWGLGWLRAALAAPAQAGSTALQTGSTAVDAQTQAQAQALAHAQAEALARARLALDLTAALLAEPAFTQAAMAVTGQLARAFGCTMVQLGWSESAGSRVVARSDSAWHEQRADAVRLAEQAMDEALDQACSLVLPVPVPVPVPVPQPQPQPQPQPRQQPQPQQRQQTPHPALAAGPSLALSDALADAAAVIPTPADLEPPPDDLLARAAHETYRRTAAAGAVMTVPLPAGGPLVGALLFERDTPFSADDVDAAETLAAVLGPLLLLRHQGDESVVAHLRRKGRGWSAWAVGSRQAGWKLLGASAALLLVVAALWPVTHRISAPSVVEGRTQRAAVAPFEGYIAAAAARAGDTVRAGQVLATLDDRDLQLQRARWEADREVAVRREREALAGADRVAMRQAAAQAESATAQLDLVREKLQRVAIVAPFDGVVVKGDLSQRLGSPVETGQVLFELAPLDAWRVVLKVDERDIGRLQPGQRGELVLAGLPGQHFGLTAQRVLSVAEAEDGGNHFRVEAALDADAARLRPGMEGVAKIEVGEATLLWVATHRLTDWLRRTVWEWSP